MPIPSRLISPMTWPRSTASRSRCSRRTYRCQACRSIRGVERKLDEITDLTRPKSLRVPGRDGPASGKQFVGTVKLDATERGGDVGHALFVADILDLIEPRPGLGISIPCIPADPVKRHLTGTVSDLLIVRDEHPALSGGDRLGRNSKE